KSFAELSSLRLVDTAITDAGLAELATLPKLNALDVSETLIDDAGIDALLKFPALTQVNIFGTNVTPAGIAKLGSAKRKIAVLRSAWPQEDQPPFAIGSPVALDKLPPADPAGMVAKFNGTLKRDDSADKPIVVIELNGSKVTDLDLGHLRGLT